MCVTNHIAPPIPLTSYIHNTQSLNIEPGYDVIVVTKNSSPGLAAVETCSDLPLNQWWAGHQAPLISVNPGPVRCYF